MSRLVIIDMTYWQVAPRRMTAPCSGIRGFSSWSLSEGMPFNFAAWYFKQTISYKMRSFYVKIDDIPGLTVLVEIVRHCISSNRQAAEVTFTMRAYLRLRQINQMWFTDSATSLVDAAAAERLCGNSEVSPVDSGYYQHIWSVFVVKVISFPFFLTTVYVCRHTWSTAWF